MKRYQVVLVLLAAAALVVVGTAAWLRLGPGSRPAASDPVSARTSPVTPTSGPEPPSPANAGVLPTLSASAPIKPSATPGPSATAFPVLSAPGAVGPSTTQITSMRPGIAAASPTSAPVGAATDTEAATALADGDYAAAIPLLEQTLASATGAEAARLRVDLGRALYESDQYREAAAQLAAVDAESLPEALAVAALGLLARAQEAAGEWRGALAAYDALNRYDSVPADVVRFQAARAYLALDEPGAAIAQLEAIDLAAVRSSRRAEILEELATARAAAQDFPGAAAEYARILTFAENYAYRAQVLARQADSLRMGNRNEEAIPLWRTLVRDYAGTASAAQGVRALDLLNLGSEISDLDRGVILYNASQYAEALAALNRSLSGQPTVEPDRAHYYAGLAHQDQGDYTAAVAEFDALIAGTPGSALLADASMARIRSLAALEQDAATAYEQFADANPQSAQAPQALWLAAEGQERQRNWSRAAYYYGLMHTRYPGDSGAGDARFREALMAYAGGDATRAIDAWTVSLSGATGDARARILTWLGLASRRAGNETSAADYWRQAAAQSPTSYYGLRARDLLAGRSLLMAEDAGGPIADSATTADEWEQIEDWVVQWAGTTALQTSVADRPLVRQSQVMWTLDWHAEAVELLRLVRPEIEDDAGAVLSLLRITAEQGIAPFSIWGAERLATLGAGAGAGDPPAALLELAYPTTYGHLVSAEANRLAVDPLLFLGLVRQESRFDPHSQSWAGALGLTQVIPSTGEDIAAALGTADYRHDMLRRPVLSVQFGVWYLSRMLELCERDWIAAISSYNGGYGNVTKWADGEIPIADHDLFYELVPYSETKSYIRLVYENYRLYEALYR